jgi:hypothetical protein
MRRPLNRSLGALEPAVVSSSRRALELGIDARFRT